MKKLFLLCFGVFLLCNLQGQDFDKYFTHNTLRINYIHSGSALSEQISRVEFHNGGCWYGTTTHLIDPFNYGELLLEAFDATTGERIFTRSYSCLFSEYVNTFTGQKESADFEECINMPMPKNPIKFSIVSYDRKRNATTLYTGNYDPQNTKTAPHAKEFGTIDLHIGGKSENCLDILFIPDGYTQADKKVLIKDMKRFAKYVMECSPYKENQGRVNIRALLAYSPEHGVSDPNENIKHNTLLNSSFNTIGSDRYLMCENVWRMFEVADDAPCDAILVIGKSNKYGGGGIYNFYAEVSSDDTYSNFVATHEMGHSIGGLADEYHYTDGTDLDSGFFPEGVEPVEPNVTTLVDFNSKWKDMLDEKTPVPTPVTEEYKNTVGVYEGAGYVTHGVYRPWQDCSMNIIKYNGFCPVCQRAIVEVFHYYTNEKIK